MRVTHLCSLFAGVLDDEVLAAQISKLCEEQQQQAGKDARHGATREADLVLGSVRACVGGEEGGHFLTSKNYTSIKAHTRKSPSISCTHAHTRDAPHR